MPTAVASPPEDRRLCPECGLSSDKLYSAVIAGTYYSDRCNVCIGKKKQGIPSSSTRKDYRIRRQQEDHRKDLIQSYRQDGINPDFIKAYPEKAKERFTPEQLREAERKL